MLPSITGKFQGVEINENLTNKDFNEKNFKKYHPFSQPSGILISVLQTT